MRLGAQTVRDLFSVEEVPEVEPRYNVSPTNEMPVVGEDKEGHRHVRLMRWGLVPFWAKDVSIGQRLINAKSETAHEKPAFKQALERRRCLIPADGFYEWMEVEEAPAGGGEELDLFGDPRPSTLAPSRKPKTYKQPYHFTLKGGAPFAFAGLYERWNDPASPHPASQHPLYSFTVLTCEPNTLVAQLHDRMPVIVLPENYDRWLDRNLKEPEAVQDILHPLPAELMQSRPVNRLVGNPIYDSPELLDDPV
jgi:putative SOS response-associated peptidase YedK